MRKWLVFAIVIVVMASLILSLGGCRCGPRATPTPTATPSLAATPTPTPTPRATVTPTPTGELGELLRRAEAITSVKYDQVITAPGQPTITWKVWEKGNKLRMEMTVEGQTTVFIINPDKQRMYQYFPAQKMAIAQPYEPATGATSTVSMAATETVRLMLAAPQLKVVGSETIEGKACVVVEYADPQGALKAWIWRERGFPLRLEFSMPTGKMTMELKNIEFVSIPDSMFELPPGVQVTEQR